MTSASPVEIVEAFAAAIAAAHSGDWSLDDPTSMQLCPRCLATVRTAADIAQRNDPTAGPNPLLAVVDEARESRGLNGATP